MYAQYPFFDIYKFLTIAADKYNYLFYTHIGDKDFDILQGS